MKNSLSKAWRDGVAQSDRDLVVALRLPWETAGFTVGGAAGGIGAVVGLFFGFLGLLGGAFVGFALGYLLVLLPFAICSIIPAPFAWLARRLGYA